MYALSFAEYPVHTTASVYPEKIGQEPFLATTCLSGQKTSLQIFRGERGGVYSCFALP